MARPSRAPFYPLLAHCRGGHSLFAAGLCVCIPLPGLKATTGFPDYVVLWLTLAMYGIGLLYYFGLRAPA